MAEPAPDELACVDARAETDGRYLWAGVCRACCSAQFTGEGGRGDVEAAVGDHDQHEAEAQHGWVGQSLGGLPAGTYAYDIPGKCLVRLDEAVHVAYPAELGDASIAFVLRAEASRAMWRYRDIRALRPMLIDAGHVAETLVLVLGRMGVLCEVVSPPVSRVRHDYLDEPELALVRPVGSRTQPGGEVGKERRAPWGRSAIPANAPEAFLTNPAAFLSFDGGFQFNVVWPERRTVPLDGGRFMALNHCQPSTRGDRPTSDQTILAADPTLSPSDLAELTASGALLPVPQACKLHDGAPLWSRHDWFLPMLAHLEALADGAQRPAVSRIDASTGYLHDLGVMRLRKTTRSFAPAAVAVAVAVVLDLLHRFGSNLPSALELRLGSSAVSGLAPGLYRWAGRLEGPLVPLDRAAVAPWSTGQVPVSSGAATIWLTTQVDPSSPAGYERDLIDLGRGGQRICPAAEKLGLGVFLTPAVYDTKTSELLGLAGTEPTVTYVFGIGQTA